MNPTGRATQDAGAALASRGAAALRLAAGDSGARPGPDRHDPRPRPGHQRRHGAGGAGHRHEPGHAVLAQHDHRPDGQYALRLLPLGTTSSRSRSPGFKTFSQTGILVEVGRNARIDATIEPGGLEEVVSVQADASLVETSSSALSRTVGQNEVLNLPLVNRDLYSLLSITGGVSSNDSSNSLGAPEQLTTINGSTRAQIGSVNFQLDGGNNTAGLRGTGNAAPNPEAIQEFRVITNSYAAEYGRYQAGIVDIVTKSGTNQFHGAVYEYFRNESLNAERWAPPGVEPTKDPLDRNQFGAAFGGPIQKDKTFFFVSYSGLRQEGTYYRNTARRPHGSRAGRQLLAVGDQAPGPGRPASRSRAASSRRRASTRRR